MKHKEELPANSDRVILLRPECTDPARADKPALAMSLVSGSGAYGLHFAEPPSADPHARWCGEDGQQWPSLPDFCRFSCSD